jgi:hypothetical protein
MQNKVYTSNAFNNFISFIQVSQLKLYAAFQHVRIEFISVCYTLTTSTDKVAYLPVRPRGEARQNRRDRGEAEATTTRRGKASKRRGEAEAAPLLPQGEASASTHITAYGQRYKISLK